MGRLELTIRVACSLRWGGRPVILPAAAPDFHGLLPGNPMESDYFSQVAGYIDTAYRQLVAACADDTPPKVEEAVAVLGSAQRSAAQLAADVRVLRQRRADAAVLQDLVELDAKVAAGEERYAEAVERKNGLIRAVEAAKGHGDNLDSQRLYDAAICAAAEAAQKATAALDELSSIRQHRDMTRAGVERRLRMSAAEADKWSDPAMFSLQ